MHHKKFPRIDATASDIKDRRSRWTLRSACLLNLAAQLLLFSVFFYVESDWTNFSYFDLQEVNEGYGKLTFPWRQGFNNFPDFKRKQYQSRNCSMKLISSIIHISILHHFKILIFSNGSQPYAVALFDYVSQIWLFEYCVIAKLKLIQLNFLYNSQ